MSLTATIQKSAEMGGKLFSGSKSLSADAVIIQEESIAAAKAGSLTTRTDNDTGVVTTTNPGHGITTEMLVDLYWTGGCRRGMTVTNVVDQAVSVNLGLGDNLPDALTAVAIIVPTEFDVAVLGTNVRAIALYAEARSQFVFEDAGGEELARELSAGSCWTWDDEDGETNPITGDSIIAVQASHDDTASARTVRIGVLYNND